MAYTIDTYSNSKSWKIEDGTIDQTTDLKLVGKNYAGYGEIQNENLIFLLENFSGQVEPPRKIQGQLWFDSSNSKLKFYDGLKWRTTGGAESSASIPTGLKQGDFWWDTGNEQLYTYNGGDFVLIGPQSAGSGQTQIISRSVRDTTGTSRNIITSVVDDEVVMTFSAQDFTIDTADVDSAIPGFDRIRPGLTLKNTINSSGGITSGAYRLQGTASNAEKLGGVVATSYVQSNNASFTGLASFPEAGLQIGDSGDISIKVVNDNRAVFSNDNGQFIDLKAKDLQGNILNPITIRYDAIIPGAYAAATIGGALTAERWPTVYADAVKGVADLSTALLRPNAVYNADPGTGTLTTTDAIYPSEATAANTLPIRDALGDIYARRFQGIATEAWYADLAEKYTTAEELPAGTAVAVGSDESDAEVIPASASHYCIGVVSTDPALMMNSGAEGQYIGLKGRLPVRVTGSVKKGQALYAWQDGVCSTLATTAMVGIALESNDSVDEKLIECTLKV
jgi:hypothetical protein|tara:strand:- start:1132 stop:2655 length:1524 start_codon:yes stop_codon:yes gene_type:complete